MIEDATIDAYNDEEQITGLFTMLEEHLALPFQTTVLGVTITVTKIHLTTGNEIVAICRRDAHKQAIPILDLPLPDSAPDGVEWIDAYRRWRRWRRHHVSAVAIIRSRRTDDPASTTRIATNFR